MNKDEEESGEQVKNEEAEKKCGGDMYQSEEAEEEKQQHYDEQDEKDGNEENKEEEREGRGRDGKDKLVPRHTCCSNTIKKKHTEKEEKSHIQKTRGENRRKTRRRTRSEHIQEVAVVVVEGGRGG